jgi:hypothetical protein
MSIVDKKVKLELVGLDGNAFSLMGAFRAIARREKWTPEEIEKVLTECMSGDYNHLLATLMDHCESPEREDDGDEWDTGNDDDCDDEEPVNFN